MLVNLGLACDRQPLTKSGFQPHFLSRRRHDDREIIKMELRDVQSKKKKIYKFNCSLDSYLTGVTRNDHNRSLSIGISTNSACQLEIETRLRFSRL